MTSPLRTLRPFRFGLHFWELPATDWASRARHYEDLGFSTLTLTDHLVVPQWEPLAGLGALAAATERVDVGSLVLDMGLRDPVLTAKAAATIERVSGGRLELGLGAGYVAANFTAAGARFATAGDRVDRLEESILVMRQLWEQPSTNWQGRYFQIVDSPMVAAEPVSPHVLVGGGGQRVMRLGGRVADTVSMIARQTSGQWSVVDSLADSTIDRMAEKAAWVRGGAADAGRDPLDVELHTMVATTVVGDDPEEAIERRLAADGITPTGAADSTLYLCGDGGHVRSQLERWRAEAGISYVSFFDPGDEQIEWLAEQVVAPLAATR